MRIRDRENLQRVTGYFCPSVGRDFRLFWNLTVGAMDYFRDCPKFTGCLGRVLGILPRVKNSAPPFFLLKKVLAASFFDEKKSPPPFYSMKKVSAPFSFDEKSHRPLFFDEKKSRPPFLLNEKKSLSPFLLNQKMLPTPFFTVKKSPLFPLWRKISSPFGKWGS